MGKAMFIMNMPSKCSKCEMARSINYFNWECRAANKLVTHDFMGNNDRPCWCPLKEVPEMKEELRKEQYEFGNLGLAFIHGWNACLKSILNKT